MKQSGLKGVVVGGRKSDRTSGNAIPEIDASTFYSPAISADIRSAYPIILECPDDVIRKIIAVIVQYMVTGDSFKLPTKIYALDVKHEDINLLLVTVYMMLKQAIRTKVKVSIVHSDLLALKMPQVFVDEISKAIVDYRSAIEASAQVQRIHFAKFERLRWRIDIVISTGTLSRVMRPTILMQVDHLTLQLSEHLSDQCLITLDRYLVHQSILL